MINIINVIDYCTWTAVTDHANQSYNVGCYVRQEILNAINLILINLWYLLNLLSFLRKLSFREY